MQAYEDYDWAGVPIGRGGYITGMKIHPLNGEKRYYRTDVGGAYRWDAETTRMEQMVFSTNSSHYSVAGIALHSTNQDIVNRHVLMSGIAFLWFISIQQAEHTLEYTAWIWKAKYGLARL